MGGRLGNTWKSTDVKTRQPLSNCLTTIHSTLIYNNVVINDQHTGAIFLPVRLMCANRRDSNIPSRFPGEELSFYIATLRFS